jgi:hypothetical protein
MDPANLPAMAYVWLKAVHIIAVIAWMAGLFYLPRLFVYHADAKPESVQSETFKVMERRLLGIIMNPAMDGPVVFDKACAGGGDDLVPPLAGLLLPRLRSGRQPASGIDLPDH